MKKIASIISIAIIIIFFDQLAKFLIGVYAPDLIHKNTAIAFSLPLYGDFALAVAWTALAGILFLAYKTFDFSKKLAVIAFSLVLGGAISNIIDRILRGAVFDYIDIKIWPVFNIADIAITVGVLSVIFFYDKIKKVRNL